MKRHGDTMRRSLASGGRGFRFDHCSSSTSMYSSMTVSEVIRTKRAVRQFSDEPLSEEAMRTILMAGRRAQSSKNTQSWHFIAIGDRATLQQLAECGAYAGHLARAPFAVALIASTADSFDLGQAAAYMQLAAWDLGIGSCIASMWGPCLGDR